MSHESCMVGRGSVLTIHCLLSCRVAHSCMLRVQSPCTVHVRLIILQFMRWLLSGWTRLCVHWRTLVRTSMPQYIQYSINVHYVVVLFVIITEDWAGLTLLGVPKVTTTQHVYQLLFDWSTRRHWVWLCYWCGERHKGSGDLAFRSPVVDEEGRADQASVVGVCASSFFKCFDTVGWVTERAHTVNPFLPCWSHRSSRIHWPSSTTFCQTHTNWMYFV